MKLNQNRRKNGVIIEVTGMEDKDAKNKERGINNIAIERSGDTDKLGERRFPLALLATIYSAPPLKYSFMVVSTFSHNKTC